MRQFRIINLPASDNWSKKETFPTPITVYDISEKRCRILNVNPIGDEVATAVLMGEDQITASIPFRISVQGKNLERWAICDIIDADL